ncbi:hypothetical protein [Shimazuella kribbensis]|uniref:hypothetical protein n=1 Tax=Shimazuella kribbensis TaxID=139808 RepID=UPI0004109F39|nr:hypothetical protein [Shimazuella kribbensis]
MRKLTLFSITMIRKLLTSLITAAFCMGIIFILQIITETEISSVLEHLIGSLLVFVVLLISISVVGSIVSMFSDLITWKLSSPWRMMVASLIHVGSAMAYVFIWEKFDVKLEIMFLTVALFFWIIDEMFRFFQDRLILLIKRIYKMIFTHEAISNSMKKL